MRTIESAGVEIREIDLSFYTQLPVGTTIFAVGYAAQGPTDELINITSLSEFEQIYGQPTNAAERYFYQTCKQVLIANGTLMTTRLPYGSAAGVGYQNNYSALVYPIFPYSNDMSTYTVTSATGTTTFLTASVATSAAGTINFFALASGSGMLELSNNPNFSISGANVRFVVDSGTLSANKAGWSGTWVLESSGLEDTTYAYTISSTVGPLTGNYAVTYTYGKDPSTIAKLTDASNYYIGQPSHMSIDESTYQQWQMGGINWKDTVTYNLSSVATTSTVGYAGMIIVNEAKTAIDDIFAGYYIAIADNSKMDKGSEFDSILNVKTINDSTENSEWLDLNTNRLAFSLSGTLNQRQGSVSEIVETLPSWDFSNKGIGGYSDSIVIGVFKIRPTLYNAEDRVLDKLLVESYIGSFDSTRTINNPRGGAPLNFHLADVVNKGTGSMKMFINPNISVNSGAWFDNVTSEPIKTIRVMCGERVNTESSIATDSAQPYGKAKIALESVNADTYMLNADSMYGVGEYVPCNSQSVKSIGNVPLKVERALRLAENRELIRVDIVPEGGLGTVWTGTQLDTNNWEASQVTRNPVDQIQDIFDDTVYINGILNASQFDADSAGLLDQETGSASEASDLYEAVYGVFNDFCETTRKDCLYIADPLRQIFVQGNGDIKVLTDKTKNFSQHIYWPLKNQFGAANTSYGCTYSNWLKVNDTYSGRFVWAPASGWASRLMVQTDTNFYPWYAPAGLTRGILQDVVDIGINPSQKQRDLLYKIGINPIVYWPGDGYIVWGQKTLQKKPSAFDRINVRRLFLWLEKAVLQLARYFVFEQNTVFTRTRLIRAIEPIFNFAKSNEGIYDYMIVCDERNNTPDVIDRNELIVDIYIKPVKVAEFILINFIATRTGQDFNELI